MVLTAGCAASEDADRGFGAEDEAAVRALEESYRNAWLSNDSAAVMATLAPGAVLMPAGMEPIEGDSAIRAFWWPDDGSSTVIQSYDIEVDEVRGSGDLAVLRGRGSIEFVYASPEGQASRLASNAVHLSVAEADSSGTWRITRRAWSAIR